MKIPVKDIIPNPQQPRTEIQPESLVELADSIKTHGLINPISVEQGQDGKYILIDGERRWRATMLAGLPDIEAAVRPGMNGAGDLNRLILATIGNLQREDMSALDKARAFQKLLDIGLSQAEVAREVGLSLASIQNYLMILRLPSPVQAHIGAGRMTGDARAVRALLNMADETTMMAVVRGAIARKLDAGQVVTLARRISQGKKAARGHSKAVKSRAELSAAWAGKWNMIAQAGNPALSAEWRAAAVKTCLECPLFEDASPKICRDCSAPALLRRLVGGDK